MACLVPSYKALLVTCALKYGVLMIDEAQNMIAIFTTDDGKLQEDRKSGLQRPCA